MSRAGRAGQGFLVDLDFRAGQSLRAGHGFLLHLHMLLHRCDNQTRRRCARRLR